MQKNNFNENQKQSLSNEENIPFTEKQQLKNQRQMKNGKWTSQEHKKYIDFIEFNKEKIRVKSKKRLNKFFVRMSEIIGTRSSVQCRSHHQKLQMKYKFPSRIIKAFWDSKKSHKDKKRIKVETKSSENSEKQYSVYNQPIISSNQDPAYYTFFIPTFEPNLYLQQQNYINYCQMRYHLLPPYN